MNDSSAHEFERLAECECSIAYLYPHILPSVYVIYVSFHCFVCVCVREFEPKHGMVVVVFFVAVFSSHSLMVFVLFQ